MRPQLLVQLILVGTAACMVTAAPPAGGSAGLAASGQVTARMRGLAADKRAAAAAAPLGSTKALADAPVPVLTPAEVEASSRVPPMFASVSGGASSQVSTVVLRSLLTAAGSAGQAAAEHEDGGEGGEAVDDDGTPLVYAADGSTRPDFENPRYLRRVWGWGVLGSLAALLSIFTGFVYAVCATCGNCKGKLPVREGGTGEGYTAAEVGATEMGIKLVAAAVIVACVLGVYGVVTYSASLSLSYQQLQATAGDMATRTGAAKTALLDLQPNPLPTDDGAQFLLGLAAQMANITDLLTEGELAVMGWNGTHKLVLAMTFMAALAVAAAGLWAARERKPRVSTCAGYATFIVIALTCNMFAMHAISSGLTLDVCPHLDTIATEQLVQPDLQFLLTCSSPGGPGNTTVVGLLDDTGERRENARAQLAQLQSIPEQDRSAQQRQDIVLLGDSITRMGALLDKLQALSQCAPVKKRWDAFKTTLCFDNYTASLVLQGATLVAALALAAGAYFYLAGGARFRDQQYDPVGA
eukprot:PLAT1546.1.p1 GENE.PLAT1546.1~~PLAT1546.1.p1  ORF type:complete len:536 (+),score=283.07 PLAT1546.1:35-1609(+)